jgi:transcriptional regulator with XRE-family HTH domain
MGIGADLKKAREEAGITLQAVSDKTKINIPFLEAIETRGMVGFPLADFREGFFARLRQNGEGRYGFGHASVQRGSGTRAGYRSSPLQYRIGTYPNRMEVSSSYHQKRNPGPHGEGRGSRDRFEAFSQTGS